SRTRSSPISQGRTTVVATSSPNGEKGSESVIGWGAGGIARQTATNAAAATPKSTTGQRDVRSEEFAPRASAATATRTTPATDLSRTRYRPISKGRTTVVATSSPNGEKGSESVIGWGAGGIARQTATNAAAATPKSTTGQRDVRSEEFAPRASAATATRTTPA